VLIDSLAKLNRVSRNSISAALVVIVIIAVYSWIVAPHVTLLFAVQQYESVVDDVVKKKRILSSETKIKRKKLEKLSEQFTQMQSSLFTIDEVKQFFSNLQVISEQSSCKVCSLNLTTREQNSKDGRSKDSSGIVTKSAILSVISTYSDIIKLIERLQAHPKKVWVNSFRMSSLNDASGQLECDITITICAVQDKESVPHE